jgi:hypothetical protein
MTPLMRRPRSRHKAKRLVLIACEGAQTEPNYFHGLRTEEAVRTRFKVTVLPGCGKNPLETVQNAMRIAETSRSRGRDFEFDEVWCVLDVEEAGKNPKLAQARQMAGRSGCRVVLSNPSFEVWLLAHFKRTSMAFLNGGQVIEGLNKPWRRAFGCDYTKNDDQVYGRLRDRTAAAVKNAKSVRERDWRDTEDVAECNSATEVYQIVGLLLGS